MNCVEYLSSELCSLEKKKMITEVKFSHGDDTVTKQKELDLQLQRFLEYFIIAKLLRIVLSPNMNQRYL